jgi:hypothetical protein
MARRWISDAEATEIAGGASHGFWTVEERGGVLLSRGWGFGRRPLLVASVMGTAAWIGGA